MKCFLGEPKKSEINNENVYSIDDIKNNFDIRSFGDDLFYVLKPTEDYWLDFCFLTFVYSDLDGSNVHAEILFYGGGTTGSLRECRHTHWGENGYLFYPNKEHIDSAMIILTEFFDMD